MHELVFNFLSLSLCNILPLILNVFMFLSLKHCDLIGQLKHFRLVLLLHKIQEILLHCCLILLYHSKQVFFIFDCSIESHKNRILKVILFLNLLLIEFLKQIVIWIFLVLHLLVRALFNRNFIEFFCFLLLLSYQLRLSHLLFMQNALSFQDTFSQIFKGLVIVNS